MAKQLGGKNPTTTETTPLNNDDDQKANDNGAPPADPAADAAKAAEAEAAAAAAADPTAKPADGFLEPKAVEVGKSYKFYNTQVYTTRCPYSGVNFPAGNFTPEAVEVNQWIKSQVDSNLLRAKA